MTESVVSCGFGLKKSLMENYWTNESDWIWFGLIKSEEILNFIATDYRQDLFKFKTYHFTKYFMKLRAVVCTFVFWEERGQLELF